MKIRTGFVSNSSSSSFILVIKNKDMSAREAMETMAVDSDNPFAMIGNGILDLLIDRFHEIDEGDLLGDWGYDTIDNMIKDGEGGSIPYALKDGTRVFEATCGTEDGGLEALACEMGVRIDNDNFTLESEER